LLVEDAAFALVVTAMSASIPFVAVTTVSAGRSGWARPWFTWLGALAVVGLAAAILYYPIVLYLMWLAAGSIRLARAGHVSHG
jgi:hypothetical protein